jgi:hypothetical protein
MAARPFEDLLEGDPSLLQQAERLLLEAHRCWYEALGRKDWSEPAAYQWLHYEDPDPVARLADGVRRLGPAFTAGEAELAQLEELKGRLD